MVNKTLIIMPPVITTLVITTLVITPLVIMTLLIMALDRYNYEKLKPLLLIL